MTVEEMRDDPVYQAQDTMESMLNKLQASVRRGLAGVRAQCELEPEEAVVALRLILLPMGKDLDSRGDIVEREDGR